MVEHSLANSIYPRVNNPETMHIPTVTSVIPISYQAQQIQPQTFQAAIGAIMAVWFGVYVLQQVIRVFKGEVVEKPTPLQ